MKTDKASLQHQLIQFADKIDIFELNNIDKGGYVQFIHIISQILVQITKPVI